MSLPWEGFFFVLLYVFYGFKTNIMSLIYYYYLTLVQSVRKKSILYWTYLTSFPEPLVDEALLISLNILLLLSEDNLLSSFRYISGVSIICHFSLSLSLYQFHTILILPLCSTAWSWESAVTIFFFFFLQELC